MTAAARSNHQSGANASAGEEPSDNRQAGTTVRGRQPDGDDTTGDEERKGRQGKGLPNKKAEGEHTHTPILVFFREGVFVEQLIPLR